MENTGRISRGLTPTGRKILFGETADVSIDTELSYTTRVDCAHLLMLAECGIIDRARTSRVLREIANLCALDFAPLRGLPAGRGLFLLYEDYLVEKLGPETGGILQTARSRNDLNATILRLRLRGPYLRLLREALRLQAVLLRRVKRFAEVVMPAYTHFQAAVPITYGHYLAAVAQAIGRDIAELFYSADGLHLCPLGAGAVGGTTLPIDHERTAALLGFERPVPNSIDAVASRDLVLRMLAAQAIFGVTLSRLAADLLLWSTVEFGFLVLPDELVGSSSMMPQKRNVFLLEHVQGKSTSALGAFVAAASAMHGKPFSNSIAVGTEGVSHVWKAFENTTAATTLVRLIVAGSKPEAASMLRKASDSYIEATEFANRLACEGGMSFRTAHTTVGEMVRMAIDRGGERLPETAARWQQGQAQTYSFEGLDCVSIANAAIYGGGPGPAANPAVLKDLRDVWKSNMERKRSYAQKWADANRALVAAVLRNSGVVLKTQTAQPGNA
jgi:argininosuccinate lyase